MALATTTVEADDSLTTTVTREVANATGLDETDFVLYEYVDLSALERLYEHGTTRGDVEWTFEFVVEGVTVVVSSDGTVSIEQRGGRRPDRTARR